MGSPHIRFTEPLIHCATLCRACLARYIREKYMFVCVCVRGIITSKVPLSIDSREFRFDILSNPTLERKYGYSDNLEREKMFPPHILLKYCFVEMVHVFCFGCDGVIYVYLSSTAVTSQLILHKLGISDLSTEKPLEIKESHRNNSSFRITKPPQCFLRIMLNCVECNSIYFQMNKKKTKHFYFDQQQHRDPYACTLTTAKTK